MILCSRIQWILKEASENCGTPRGPLTLAKGSDKVLLRNSGEKET